MESLIVVLVCIIFIYLIKYLFGIKIDDVKNIKENMGNISIDSEHDILMQNKNKIKEINNIYYKRKKIQ